MDVIRRRRVILAAGATLIAAGAARKSSAAGLSDVARLLMPVDPPRAPPEGVFIDAEGREHRLAEFLGHGMVINFWATWCQPCIAEMPSLVSLAGALAPFGIAVLPLSSDRGGAKVVSAWYADHQISGLPVLLDPRGALGREFGGMGIPTTHVISQDGRERARLQGAADWSSEATVALIRKLVEG